METTKNFRIEFAALEKIPLINVSCGHYIICFNTYSSRKKESDLDDFLSHKCVWQSSALPYSCAQWRRNFSS